jgi:hypothetical protein
MFEHAASQRFMEEAHLVRDEAQRIMNRENIT